MRYILSLIFVLVAAVTLNAQMQDLTKLAEGELKYSDIIYDNDNNLWGYFYLYQADREKDSVLMEYVVLDKNLNKTYNGTYKTKKINASFFWTKYNNCILMGDQLVLDITVHNINDGSMIYNSNRTLPIVDNRKSEEFIFQRGEFKSTPENLTKYYFSKVQYDSLYNKLIVTPIYRGEQKGYMVTQFNQYLQNQREKEIKFFDNQKNLLWKYTYNPNTSNKARDNYSMYKLLNFYDKGMLAMETDYVKGQKSVVRIISQDINTGSKLFNYVLENDSSKFFHRITTRVYSDTIYIAGQYYNNKKFGNDRDFLGYFRIVLNNKGEEISKKYVPWSEVQTAELAISAKGKINKTRGFVRQSTLILDDGRVSFVNDELREQPVFFQALYFFTFTILNISESFYKDAYVINFDKSFNRKSIDKIEKPRNFYSDGFLFTQYQNSNKGAVICYRDEKTEKGEKKSNLIISTLTDVGLKTERIPLFSKKEFALVPIPAKEGYIMLHEYNEKAKYNQIRLERLND